MHILMALRGISQAADLEKLKRSQAVRRSAGPFLALFLAALGLPLPGAAALGAEDLQSGQVISEFMALNSGTLANEDGDYSDWVEIHSREPTGANLGRWCLTDADNELTK